MFVAFDDDFVLASFDWACKTHTKKKKKRHVIVFVQVGQIYQKFECRDRSDGGIVRNVVRWSIPSVLEVEFLIPSPKLLDEVHIILVVFSIWL